MAALTPTSTPVLRNPLRDKFAALQYMRDVTLMVVSQIAWYRDLCPKTEFKEVHLLGLTVNVLKRTNNFAVEYLMKNLAGAFEAMHLHYLQSLVMNIKDLSGFYVLESYTLCYKYGGDSPPLSFSSSSTQSGSGGVSVELVYKSTLHLLLQLQETLNCVVQQLPDETLIDFQLIYNDNAPDDYLSTGFRFETEEELEKKDGFHEKPIRIRQGRIKSSFGMMTFHTTFTRSMVRPGSPSSETSKMSELSL